MFSNHLSFFFYGSLMTKLGDFIVIFLWALWNFLLWENRTYTSTNLAKKTECERLLEKITETYWFCTNCRSFVNRALVPSGLVVGDGWYIAYIDISNRTEYSKGEIQVYHITLYGWWSIERLLTEEVVCQKTDGEYKIVRSMGDSHYYRTTDDFDMTHYHANCYAGCKRILDSYRANGYGVYFISGEPGMGKTTTGRLVALALGATLCLDFEDFCYSSDSFVVSFELLYNYVQPDEMSPLVIVLDELEDFLFSSKDFDTMLSEVKDTKNIIFRNRGVKKRWVRLMDTIQEKKHVILILTSNKKKRFFDKVDRALLRKYRVTESYEYTTGGVHRIRFIA